MRLPGRGGSEGRSCQPITILLYALSVPQQHCQAAACTSPCSGAVHQRGKSWVGCCVRVCHACVAMHNNRPAWCMQRGGASTRQILGGMLRTCHACVCHAQQPSSMVHARSLPRSGQDPAAVACTHPLLLLPSCLNVCCIASAEGPPAAAASSWSPPGTGDRSLFPHGDGDVDRAMRRSAGLGTSVSPAPDHATALRAVGRRGSSLHRGLQEACIELLMTQFGGAIPIPLFLCSCDRSWIERP